MPTGSGLGHILALASSSPRCEHDSPQMSTDQSIGVGKESSCPKEVPEVLYYTATLEGCYKV